MLKINENFAKLPGSYLFAEIARRTAAPWRRAPGSRPHQARHRGRHAATDPRRHLRAAPRPDEMGSAETFRGYGPYEGYAISPAREAIARHDYAPFGAPITKDDIFVSDGAKSELRQHRRPVFRTTQSSRSATPSTPSTWPERHVGPRRRLGRQALDQHRLPALQRAKRLHAGAACPHAGRHLSLLPQ